MLSVEVERRWRWSLSVFFRVMPCGIVCFACALAFWYKASCASVPDVFLQRLSKIHIGEAAPFDHPAGIVCCLPARMGPACQYNEEKAEKSQFACGRHGVEDKSRKRVESPRNTGASHDCPRHHPVYRCVRNSIVDISLNMSIRKASSSNKRTRPSTASFCAISFCGGSSRVHNWHALLTDNSLWLMRCAVLNSMKEAATEQCRKPKHAGGCMRKSASGDEDLTGKRKALCAQRLERTEVDRQAGAWLSVLFARIHEPAWRGSLCSAAPRSESSERGIAETSRRIRVVRLQDPAAPTPIRGGVRRIPYRNRTPSFPNDSKGFLR